LARTASIKGSSPVPDFIPPELATLVSKPPEDDHWLHEIKFDGYRTAARLVGGGGRASPRRGKT
jgi:bifunctional non-homologous end joining protein LigD